MSFEQFRVLPDATDDFAPAIDMDAEQTALGVLGGDCVRVVDDARIIFRRRGNYKFGQLRLELLRLRDFFVDLGRGQLLYGPSSLLFLHCAPTSALSSFP
jgi:hypothetical protein